MFRVILLALLGYLFYRILKPAFTSAPANPHVREQQKPPENPPLKNRKDIEDAEFEDLD